MWGFCAQIFYSIVQMNISRGLVYIVLFFTSLCIELIWKERNKIGHDKERTPLYQFIRELRSLIGVSF